MKRSMAQEYPSQGTSSKMTRPRHDPVDVAVTSSTTNIFLVEPILRKLFKKIESVSMLKDLRRMCQLWDRLDTEELEERAFQGKLKPVEFSNDNFQEDLQLFLKETESNPKLFRSFGLGFQDAFKFLDVSFFKLYRPQFLEVDFPEEFIFTQEVAQYLGDFLSWISKDIQELQVQIPDHKKNVRVEGVLPAAFQSPLVFPNLTRFSYRQIFENKKYLYIQHFSCILNRSREVDPTPNLIFLEIEPKDGENLEHLFGSDPTTSIALSRWSKLTHLSLDTNCNLQRVTSMLCSLASAGMSLESLNLYCEPQEPGLNFDAICSDLSRFFATHAKSLKILKLVFHLGDEYNENEPFGKIWWPIFENVHTLELKYLFFDMGPIPVHFPSVQNLTFDTYLDPKTMLPDGIQPLSIHNLSIGVSQIFGFWRNGFNSPDAWIDWLESKFRSVLHLTCSSLVKNSQGRIPWSATLEELELTHVISPIKVGHLKALKKLVIRPLGLSQLELLKTAWFQEALTLNLSSITFMFETHMPSNELKDEFNRYFPFPVKFQEITAFEYP